jgi:hypothetical protein
MNIHGLLANLENRWVLAPVAAGSAINSVSARINMNSYESAMFIVPIDSSVATGVATLKVKGHTLDQDAGMTDIVNAIASKTSAGANDIANKLLIVEVRNSSYQFIQANLVSAVANIAFGNTIVLLKTKTVPVTPHSTVAASAYVSD